MLTHVYAILLQGFFKNIVFRSEAFVTKKVMVYFSFFRPYPLHKKISFYKYPLNFYSLKVTQLHVYSEKNVHIRHELSYVFRICVFFILNQKRYPKTLSDISILFQFCLFDMYHYPTIILKCHYFKLLHIFYGNINTCFKLWLMIFCLLIKR